MSQRPGSAHGVPEFPLMRVVLVQNFSRHRLPTSGRGRQQRPVSSSKCWGLLFGPRHANNPTPGQIREMDLSLGKFAARCGSRRRPAASEVRRGEVEKRKPEH